MARRYRCSIFMAHTEDFALSLLKTEYKAVGEEVVRRLYLDQHDLFHDGEFTAGCDICDEEYKEHNGEYPEWSDKA